MRMMNLMVKHFYLLAFAFLLLSLTSCDPGLIYSDSYPVAGKKWERSKPFTFTTDSIGDVEAIYSAMINVRVNENYAFRNIYFFVDIEMPDKQKIRDTVNGILQDAEGNWVEEAEGFGTIKEISFPYRTKFKFPHKGVYKFTVYQAMRKEPLEDIEDVGLNIKAIEQ